VTHDELQQLYRSYGPAVRARCRAICGNHADADEALQETFVKAWRKRANFDGRHPLAWLMTIARNTSLDVLRRRRPWQGDAQLWLEQAGPRFDESAQVDATRLLDEFGAEDAAVLRLRHAEGWRIHEIAEHFETSQRTIRRRLERLELRARAILKVQHAV
jgi:RNA polymerase sigma-70 factor, ECF subfamily